MKIFKLPDLGEGLPDAVIREWYVSPGESVNEDQPLVAMETAKALVDVPAPYAGTVIKRFGDVDDTIETGTALIGFEGEENIDTPKDSGTVVGNIETSDKILQENAHGIHQTNNKSPNNEPRATPSVRALARRLNIDLSTVETNNGDRVTLDDVRAAADVKQATPNSHLPDNEMQKLPPVRHAMVLSMSKSHTEVVPVTLSDDADIHAWKGKENITIRIIRAIIAACEAEPMLNASFDSKRFGYHLNDKINLGIAVDTPHGLYVPVIKDVKHYSDDEIRTKIQQYKHEAEHKTIHQSDLHGGTIILSNYGSIAGRNANMIILPPMVAIIGIGKLRDEVVPYNGEPAIHPILPISVTADHRAVTGGELARFLKTLIDHLQG